MFVDKVTVHVQAGKGGDGSVSFRHEKWVDKGGPDGGDGGDGGSVVFVAEHNMNSLAKFRFNPKLNAKPGENGRKRRQHGAMGDDLKVNLPVGTVVYVDNKVVADLTAETQEELIAKGGRGGFGNAHFVSSTRQTPRVAEIGEPGEAKDVVLELKMLADVGLIGLPNAGKSTFLSVVTSAKPEIADYPFTTLVPNLGVADIDGSSLLVADIPGLIEGAADGKGLGDEFLRHVERTKVLLHLVDGTSDDVVKSYQTIQTELKNYQIDLSKRPQIVALSKADALDDDLIAMQLDSLRTVVPKRTKLIHLSSVDKKLLTAALRELVKVVNKKPRVNKATKPTVPVYELEPEQAWTVKSTKKGFTVTGYRIEKFAQRTDFGSEQGVRRLRDIMRRMGIFHELNRQGAKIGQNIEIAGKSFEY